MFTVYIHKSSQNYHNNIQSKTGAVTSHVPAHAQAQVLLFVHKTTHHIIIAKPAEYIFLNVVLLYWLNTPCSPLQGQEIVRG